MPGDEPAPVIHVARATGPITLDGDLSDPAWRDAARIETFYEYNPGDNLPPKVRTLAWLTYDSEAFYVAVQCDDPAPEKIRAPFVERDHVLADQDNLALFLDTHGDRRVALQLRVNPRGIQADAVNADNPDSREDFAPDFFYDAATHISPTGWTAEFRVPLRSLRFDNRSGQPWTFFMIRNYPREFRYQFSSVRIPRGDACVVCRAATLVGMTDLSSASGGVVVAPHATASNTWSTDQAGAPLTGHPADAEAGIDVKWTPHTDMAVDATVWPDFSQVESDAAQLSVNNRFALNYEEKRPFFQEGVDLLQTPLNAVYTRAITDPRWGARATGRLGATTYTLLAADDQGDGVVVLPGPTGSRDAPQDFRSRVAVARVRREAPELIVGFLTTVRESDGGAHNRVIGPDFQWRPSKEDAVAGQLLWSDTRTPRRTDLADEWDGRRLESHALRLEWRHNTRQLDWHVIGADVGRDFRADMGFVPQVGYRQLSLTVGRNHYPDRGLVTRMRTFLAIDAMYEPGGGLLHSLTQLGVTIYGSRNLFAQPYIAHERYLTGARPLDVTIAGVYATLNPAGFLPKLTIRAVAGEDVNLANERVARAFEVTTTALVRKGPRVSFEVASALRRLDQRTAPGHRAMLFTNQVQRLKATVHLSARASLRMIGQYESTKTNPELYSVPTQRRTADFGGSLLFTYRVNWQTAVYAGYGDTRALDPSGRLRPKSRELFIKLSYALQR